MSLRTGFAVALWHALLVVISTGLGHRLASDATDARWVVAGAMVLIGAVAVASAVRSDRALRRSHHAAWVLVELGEVLEACHSVHELLEGSSAELHRRLGPGRVLVAMRRGDTWIGATRDERSVVFTEVASPAVEVVDVDIDLVADEAAPRFRVDGSDSSLIHRMLPCAAKVAAVPAVAGHEVLGLVAIEFGASRRPLGADEVALVEQAVARIAVSMRTVRLHEEVEQMAAADPLTGVANRRTFDEELARSVARAERHGHPLSLAMLDLDHFKRVNDRYGHQVGDEVLRQVTDALAAATRTGDLLARYGGEEFAVILAGTDRASAHTAGERLRAAGGEVAVVPVTLSVGVASLVPGDRPDDLVAAADAALYEAKGAGRNRTVVRTRPVSALPRRG